jgi:leader peptidase (prepilin peptidase)/N-methyltransferase
VTGAAFAAVLGAVLGSFLNVVAHRLPRKRSVVRPGSRCPSCEAPVRAYDNVPVLSWLVLRGRCRDCGARISGRYPLVEAATAALLAAVVLAKGAEPKTLPALALVVLLVPITLIDLEHRIIPNALTGLGAVLAVALIAVTQPDALVEHLLAGVGAGGFLLVAALAHPGGMGMGDVKLAGVLGLFLGAAVGPAVLVALLAGSVVGAAVIAWKGAREGRKTAIPFGPFLALGGVVAIFAGDAVVAWYLGAFA